MGACGVVSCKKKRNGSRAACRDFFFFFLEAEAGMEMERRVFSQKMEGFDPLRCDVGAPSRVFTDANPPEF